MFLTHFCILFLGLLLCEFSVVIMPNSTSTRAVCTSSAPLSVSSPLPPPRFRVYVFLRNLARAVPLPPCILPADSPLAR